MSERLEEIRARQERPDTNGWPDDIAWLIGEVERLRARAVVPEREWLTKLRQQFAEYKVPEGGVVNVPEDCVVVLRRTVEKLLDAAERAVDGVPAVPAPSESVTRFEVIDHRHGAPAVGRAFVAWYCHIELSYQDAGRTLKVFVTGDASTANPALRGALPAEHREPWDERMEYLFSALPFAIRHRWGGDAKEMVEGIDYAIAQRKLRAGLVSPPQEQPQ